METGFAIRPSRLTLTRWSTTLSKTLEELKNDIVHNTKLVQLFYFPAEADEWGMPRYEARPWKSIYIVASQRTTFDGRQRGTPIPDDRVENVLGDFLSGPNSDAAKKLGPSVIASVGARWLNAVAASPQEARELRDLIAAVEVTRRGSRPLAPYQIEGAEDRTVREGV
jgi:hypothetical protein